MINLGALLQGWFQVKASSGAPFLFLSHGCCLVFRLPVRIPLYCQQFLRFGTVGSLGFLVDCASVTLLRPLLGLTLATVSAYFIAASGNWVLNRLWTFRESSPDQNLFAQWLRFLSANSIGFLLNRGAVFSLYALSPLTRHHPAIALAIGAACGMVANFNLSRRLVFQRSKWPLSTQNSARNTQNSPQKTTQSNVSPPLG